MVRNQTRLRVFKAALTKAAQHNNSFVAFKVRKLVDSRGYETAEMAEGHLKGGSNGDKVRW